MKLKLSEIITDAGTQLRAQINNDIVAEYQQAEGQLPPVIVFRDEDGKLYLGDGFHRVESALRSNKKTIEADVREGSLRDAILFAAGANSQHGLRRTNEDKRRAVTTLLEDAEWSQWPDSEIARHACVGRHFVSKIRSSLTCTRSTSERKDERRFVHKSGKITTMNVTNIGKGRRTANMFSPAESKLLKCFPGEQRVYALYDGTRCKIGTSISPESRIKEIKTHNHNASVFAIAKGGRKEEGQLHVLFECEKDIGEWFLVTPVMVVDAMRRSMLDFKYDDRVVEVEKTSGETTFSVDELESDDDLLFEDEVAEEVPAESAPKTPAKKISGGTSFNVQEFEPVSGANEELQKQDAYDRAKDIKARYQALRREFNSLHKSLKTFCETEYGEPLLIHEQSFQTHVKAITGYIQSEEPHCVCFICDGFGCDSCQNFGYMTKRRHDSRVPEDESAVIYI